MNDGPSKVGLEPRALSDAIEASKAPAISRAAAILRLLGASDAPLGVQAIARELGLVPSTCLYVLRALASEKLVAFDPTTKRYALDAGVLELARQWLRRNRFNDLAQPVLERLAVSFEVTLLGLQIIDLEDTIVVAVAQSGRNLELSAQVGSRHPAMISATGRCIAAFGDYPQAELEARFGALRWDRPPTLEAWRAEVAEARLQGVAVDRGNFMSGLTAVAAPVWKTRARLSHVLLAVGLGDRPQRGGLDELQQALRAAAGCLSSQLCGEITPG